MAECLKEELTKVCLHMNPTKTKVLTSELGATEAQIRIDGDMVDMFENTHTN